MLSKDMDYSEKIDEAIYRLRRYDGSNRKADYVSADGTVLFREELAEVGARRVLGMARGTYGDTGEALLAAGLGGPPELRELVDYILARATELGEVRDPDDDAALARAEEAARRRNAVSYALSGGPLEWPIEVLGREEYERLRAEGLRRSAAAFGR